MNQCKDNLPPTTLEERPRPVEEHSAARYPCRPAGRVLEPDDAAVREVQGLDHAQQFLIVGGVRMGQNFAGIVEHHGLEEPVVGTEYAPLKIYNKLGRFLDNNSLPVALRWMNWR